MEILQNTLLKLVVRQGTNNDRKSAAITSGEPVFTTDTKRFFVGDGVTAGGTIVGNLHQGNVIDINTIANPVIGDTVYDTDNYKLYVYDTTSTWLQVGGVYSVSNGLVLDSSSQITLSTTIPIDSIVPRSNNYVSLPNNLKINGITYTCPSTALSGKFLQTIDASGTLGFGNIALSAVSTNTITVLSGGLVSKANGTISTGQAINPLSANITIESNQLYAACLSGNSLLFSKNITSVTRNGMGNYKFTYSTLPTSNLIVTSSISGSNAYGYYTRCINTTSTDTTIIVTNASGGYADAVVSVLITY